MSNNINWEDIIVGDGDEGEDKAAKKKARDLNKLHPMQVAEKYTYTLFQMIWHALNDCVQI